MHPSKALVMWTLQYITVHYTTSCNTQSSAPENGQNNCLKLVELTGIINKPLLLHLVGCLYYLYQWCAVKQTTDNEIYLLIKYIKSVLWRAAKRLSYIEDARCLKVNYVRPSIHPSVRMEQLGSQWTDFHEILHSDIFRKSSEKIQVSIKSDKNNVYFSCGPMHMCDSTLLNSS